MGYRHRKSDSSQPTDARLESVRPHYRGSGNGRSGLRATRAQDAAPPDTKTACNSTTFEGRRPFRRVLSVRVRDHRHGEVRNSSARLPPSRRSVKQSAPAEEPDQAERQEKKDCED